MKPTLSDLAPSMIRTLVPMIVGAIGGYEATYLGLTPSQQTAYTTVAVGGLYYALVRLLEHRWPSLGILLGVPMAPVYTPNVDAALMKAVEQAVDAALARLTAPAPPVAPAPAQSPVGSAPAPATVALNLPAPATVPLTWSELSPPVQ
jgi:hypothetical protein